MFKSSEFLSFIFLSFIVQPAACPPAQAQAHAQAQATHAQWHDGGGTWKVGGLETRAFDIFCRSGCYWLMSRRFVTYASNSSL